MSPIQKTARHALRNAQAGQELAEASAAVIARRLEILGEALADPLRADHAELGRMGTEKVEALAASAGAACADALDLAEQAGRLAAREGAEAADCLARLARADTPAAFAAAQTNWAMGAWGRAVTDGWSFCDAALQAQERALAPVHAAATANARRLKR
ncbi:hypothetical protein D8I30_05430 [Brevundimonas naejangsanensis]|uniref:Phasin domain-containing protein n=1 Tax=Brevundimonas naejangsanensis TaxID=588932 RepID=A0A494RLP6_9CAUL|nr:phasin family protein [Brevundimonas naejangsanensis]AYG94684.1 hypothetical protein D8I30_05430 [Brevundimonas naejangsanensis]